MTGFREPFPIFVVADVEEAIGFYEGTFGFSTTFRFHDDDERTVFAYLALEPHGIGLAAMPADGAPEVALWLYADDVDAAAERLRLAGAEEMRPPADQQWGERTCTFRAPDGLLLHIGSRT